MNGRDKIKSNYETGIRDLMINTDMGAPEKSFWKSAKCVEGKLFQEREQ